MINLEFFINKPGDINIEVIDVLGKKVINLKGDYNSIGNYNKIINLDQMKQGFYIVRMLMSDGTVETKSVVKQ